MTAPLQDNIRYEVLTGWRRIGWPQGTALDGVPDAPSWPVQPFPPEARDRRDAIDSVKANFRRENVNGLTGLLSQSGSDVETPSTRHPEVSE